MVKWLIYQHCGSKIPASGSMPGDVKGYARLCRHDFGRVRAQENTVREIQTLRQIYQKVLERRELEGIAVNPTHSI